MPNVSEGFVNGGVNINELYAIQSEKWNEKNVELFGLSVNTTDSPFLINENLKGDLDEYWLNGTNKLKEHLLSNKTIKDREYMIKDSWDLEYNSISNLVGLSALFIFEGTGDKRVTKDNLIKAVEKINELPENTRNDLLSSETAVLDGISYVVSKVRVAYLPLVLPLGYKIKNSEYSLRTQAVRNEYLLRKINGVVKQKTWEFSDGKFKDGVNPFDEVHENNYPFLNAILGEQVTKDNFAKALELMPEYKYNSVLYFSFKWFEEVEHKILHARKTAKPKQNAGINYVSIINSKNRFVNSLYKDLCSNLVITKSKIKSLEVSRSVIFAPVSKANYLGPFSFTDTDNVFDAFKVSTNSMAGRIRVLLDNIYVEDDMLKVDYKGKTYNQYDLILGNVPKELTAEGSSNLSALSRSPYNYLNDAKRIMFCAKLRGQAVRVNGQIDDLTHEVPARVVFADWLGFSFGDSFVISESFAKRLERNVTKKFELKNADLKKYNIGDKLTIQDLIEIDQKDRFSSWRDIRVTGASNGELEVTARTPFGVGDKITNLHGSKGIVSIILPDEFMPRLEKDLSENMPAGPVDVIVPGISVYRRKSTGQIFEAASRALDIGELSLTELNKKHRDELKKYEKSSKFKFMGKEFNAPCGINHFIRLDHDATSKQSFAYIKSNYKFNLHVAEMELLNLAARGYYNILNELDIRSLNKHTNTLEKIINVQKTGFIENEKMNSPYLTDYMKYLGWDLSITGTLSKEDIDIRWESLMDMDIVSNEEIDIFDGIYDEEETEEENLLI